LTSWQASDRCGRRLRRRLNVALALLAGLFVAVVVLGLVFVPTSRILTDDLQRDRADDAEDAGD
jgi:hypothetical protein